MLSFSTYLLLFLTDGLVCLFQDSRLWLILLVVTYTTHSACYRCIPVTPFTQLLEKVRDYVLNYVVKQVLHKYVVYWCGCQACVLVVMATWPAVYGNGVQFW